MPATVGFLLFTIGAPLAVVNAVTLSGVIGSTLIATGLSIAGSLAANALLNKPQQPRPEDGQISLRQAVASRKSGYGRQRIGGIYMLYAVANNGASIDVLAMHHGEIDAFERYFLGDDEVTLDDLGRVVHAENYHQPDEVGGYRVVSISTKVGFASETVHGFATSLVPSIWTSNHRGDGIASLALACYSVPEDQFAGVYPTGLPVPTAVARLQKVYDPRYDSVSWSTNPALCLAHYLTAPHGLGLDWYEAIEPALDLWIAAANVCDESVALKAGGTQPRYECHGTYAHDDDPSAVITALRSTMDAMIWQRPDGAIGIRAGKYVAPTVHIGPEHILGYQVQLGEAIERSVTEIKATYTDQSQDFASAEADPWTLGGVEALLGRSLSMSLDLGWVGHHAQARRLTKREAARQSTWVKGQITTNLYGLNALGERYMTVSIPELGTQFVGLIVEITDIEIDVLSGATISWIAADPNIDAWDAATEEGTAPGIAETYVPAATAPPDDLAAEAATVSGSTFITATFTGSYDDRGLQIRIEWQLDDIGGGTPGAWQSQTFPAADDGAGNYSYDIGPVVAGTDYNVRVAIVTPAGALTAYSDPVAVET